MKYEKISNQFKTMGYLLIAQVAFAIMFFFLFNKSESIESIEQMYIVGSIIQILFFALYVNWWFVMSELFLNSSQETDLGKKPFSALNKQKSDNKNQEITIQRIIMIAFLILVILYLTR